MKIAWAALFLLLHFISAAQSSTTTHLKQQLTDYLEARNKIAPLNAAVIVTKGTEVLTQHFFGHSHAATKTPITASTSFLIASGTKPFTATAIMLLQQRKMLSLTDPIHKWIKEVPSTWGAITIKHLLSHTSGIPDYFTIKGGESLQPTLNHLLQLYKGTTLQFQPGAKFAYSNTNFMLLSYVIEKCSGTTYEAFMQSQLFDPLQLTSTGFAYPEAPRTLAHSYRNVFNMDAVAKGELANLAVLKGAGGMYSTTKDLVLFLNSLSKLLSKAIMDTMLQPVMGDYALGWHVQNQFGKVTIKHPGGINGYSSEMRYVPADSLAIVILSNIGFNDLNIRYTAFDIMKMVNGVLPQAELAINPAYLGKYSVPERYAGRFKSAFIEMIHQEGRLILSIPGSSTRILIPADKGRFFFYGEAVDVEFKEEGKLLRILSPSLGQIDCTKLE
jgi:CubicO group peptidase (beta-lactamase class C family)